MARPVTVYLSIGTNVGNRAKNIRSALRHLRGLAGAQVARISSIYETSPVGGVKQRAFLNCGVEIKTRLKPLGLLVELKRIEGICGRRPNKRRGAPRILDIDIIFYGRLRLKTRCLSIPHPQALKRKFVLAPLAELRPGKHRRGQLSRKLFLGRPLSRLNDATQNVTVYENG